MPIRKPQIMENCVGCKLCVLACALHNKKSLSVGEVPLRIKEENGQFAAEIDLGMCDSCEQCLKACPRNCLEIIRE